MPAAILDAIRTSLRTLSGESLAGAALGLTVFCMVMGSASVTAVVGPGRKLRWLALALLAAIAVVLVVRDRRLFAGRRLPVGAVALGSWLIALSLVSVTWSVDPRLTIGRAGSFAILFVAAVGFGLACRTRPGLPRALLLGILGGAAAAAFAGLLVLAFSYWDAIQPKSNGGPSRYRGFGESPDTIAMLAALAAPIALWTLLQARTAKGRLAGLGAVLLLVGSISGSGSRGGLLAAAVAGMVVAVFLPVSLRRRASLVLAVCVTMAGAAGVSDYIKPQYPAPAPVPGQQSVEGAQGQGGGLALGASVDAGPPQAYVGLLADELFRTYAGDRPFLSSSGRLQAWYEAAKQADARPLLGYGFGTEDHVFIDRVYNFNGGHVESSIVGFYLQMGAIGLLSLLGLFVALAVAGVRAARRAATLEAPAIAAVGLVAAGLILTLVQSYAYAVGNVATAAFWVGAFVAAGIATRSGPPVATSGEATEGKTFATA